MADGRHFKQSKNGHISAKVQAIDTKLARWCTLPLWTGPSVKNFKFEKSKMADAAILKHWKAAMSRKGSTGRHEIRLGDAHWPSERDGQLKFRIFKNQRWQTATVFCKIGKRSYLRNGSSNQHEIWHVDAYWPCEQVQQSKFPTFKIKYGEGPPFETESR